MLFTYISFLNFNFTFIIIILRILTLSYLLINFAINVGSILRHSWTLRKFQNVCIFKDKKFIKVHNIPPKNILTSSKKPVKFKLNVT